MPDGGFGYDVPPFPSMLSEQCMVGRMLVALVEFEYQYRDMRIAGAVQWLLNRQLLYGRWNRRSASHPEHSPWLLHTHGFLGPFEDCFPVEGRTKPSTRFLMGWASCSDT